jgi:hypothetical protein
MGICIVETDEPLGKKKLKSEKEGPFYERLDRSGSSQLNHCALRMLRKEEYPHPTKPYQCPDPAGPGTNVFSMNLDFEIPSATLMNENCYAARYLLLSYLSRLDHALRVHGPGNEETQSIRVNITMLGNTSAADFRVTHISDFQICAKQGREARRRNCFF